MKLSQLLSKLKDVPEIEVEERVHQDGTKAFVFFSLLPFPKYEPAWYVIVVKPEQEDVDDKEVEAMLRHLWELNLDILPVDLAASAGDDEDDEE